ncbi:response regulator [Herbaspirillum huttiense F1]|uniref:Response regulator n=1 Tax=Herbaspirillum huttiense subsp. lycopersici TaxID=3074428 RepID=A0ABU2ELL8_9BURK|nr:MULTISPECIES: response regulator [Herbaspirillum]MBP1315515.1 DNA-binding NarL/FixJ family response regulator [Herbaspirillum sp. 1130]MDR6740924.1 DNA-binding NarL/FixJ family response regulator [Herbaspirillum sp. 1173]MDR9849031.1 response regulator [Herbaspirillum huttiense SE1]MDT0356514.1 response regulator [Herbaspirillum huttiense F1]
MDDNLNSRAQRDSDGTPLRIFLVEDSEDVRDLIVESLSEIAGVRLVGYAETELEALRHLQQNSYDVLILDIQLKQGNGMSLLQSLARSNTRRQSEVKVVFSNHVSPTYRRVGVQCGVQHFFDKSSELPLLCDLLEELAQKRAGKSGRTSSSSNTPPQGRAQTGGM